MCFARTGLSVDQIGTIIAVQHVHDKRQGCPFENFKLGAILPEHLAKDKIFASLLGILKMR